MPADRLTRWLNLGANVAVLVGIIFIIAEMRQNQALMRAQISQARADNLTARYTEQTHSDYWPAIIAKRAAVGGDVAIWANALLVSRDLCKSG
jgi:hypothetical protein